MQLKAQPVQRVPSNAHLYLRGTAAYWFPVFYSKPPALDSEFQIISTDDERSIKVQLFEAEDRELAFAALAGKISYLYWQAYGDDFDVSGSQTNDLRAFTARFATKKLLELAENIKTAAREKYFLSNNAGKFYLGIRWNQLRATTDKFDRALLEEAGMIDFWKPLNIWYRQTMRATRENLNSKPVPSAVVEKFPISD
jgi:hypothetical protein